MTKLKVIFIILLIVVVAFSAGLFAYLSGIGAAQLLSTAGAAVTLLDQNEKAQEDQIRSKFDNTLTAEEMSRINIVIGDLPQVTSDSAAAGENSGFDLVVPSPAVPLDSPLVERMLLAGVPVISEIELGFLFEKGKVLAITGTNGKTTTTTLVGEIMKAAAEQGLYSRAFVVGNIGRNKRDRTLMEYYPEGSEEGKPAVTHYRVIERLGYVTLVECRLETGRTHQIRVHMKHAGHTLFNDKTYGGDQILKGTTFARYSQFVRNCFDICPRQALHAGTLGFRHPRTGEEMDFEAPLPADMARLVEKWREYVSNRNY